jgi:DegV family protein with EDD domain
MLRLTPENTALVLDSTADIPAPEREHPNWRMVPLLVRFGSESLRDYAEIDPGTFYRRLGSERELPQTSAPPPGAYAAVLEELGGYERILVLPVSARLSASAANAELAARQVDPAGERIAVLDGGAVSAGTALLADALQRRLTAGTTWEELDAWFSAARERIAILFAVETLEFLLRGGRIGRGQALVGSMLGVRPLLELRHGEVVPYGRVRGRVKAMREFERFLCRHVADGESARIGLAHAGDPAAAEALREMAARVRPTASVDRVCELGAVVGTHGGPGTIGMLVLPGE